ncbi:hypothetical protein [Streptomyces mirabilis]|uniref:hypothetical protein n=1 Tax=Streptomyces mirabilis TaxID=68239 RepID=UPI00332C6250
MRIEETVGFTNITTGRGRPLTVTDNGRDFLNEAEQLLSLLDKHIAWRLPLTD